MSEFSSEVESLVKKEKLPAFLSDILLTFYPSYIQAAEKNGYSEAKVTPCLIDLLHFAVKQISHPYRFEPFHKALRAPDDYYSFGNHFIEPLIDQKNSQVFGKGQLKIIENQLKEKENVIFFANHQIEPDPQVISLLLEKEHPALAEEMIFVAGHRVVTDPLAVPLSLGRNLFCIFSKKHVEHPPEQKAEKLMHNQKTIKKMVQLLKEGGKCIYVAPSGGRDRPDPGGKILPAKLDPQSIDLFLLVAKQAKRKTHFYPLTLSTHSLFPPPNHVEKEIGEQRIANAAPVFLHFGDELQLDDSKIENTNKEELRALRADKIWEKLHEAYLFIEKEHTKCTN